MYKVYCHLYTHDLSSAYRYKTVTFDIGTIGAYLDSCVEWEKRDEYAGSRIEDTDAWNIIKLYHIRKDGGGFEFYNRHLDRPIVP